MKTILNFPKLLLNAVIVFAFIAFAINVNAQVKITKEKPIGKLNTNNTQFVIKAKNNNSLLSIDKIHQPIDKIYQPEIKKVHLSDPRVSHLINKNGEIKQDIFINKKCKACKNDKDNSSTFNGKNIKPDFIEFVEIDGKIYYKIYMSPQKLSKKYNPAGLDMSIYKGYYLQEILSDINIIADELRNDPLTDSVEVLNSLSAKVYMPLQNFITKFGQEALNPDDGEYPGYYTFKRLKHAPYLPVKSPYPNNLNEVREYRTTNSRHFKKSDNTIISVFTIRPTSFPILPVSFHGKLDDLTPKQRKNLQWVEIPPDMPFSMKSRGKDASTIFDETYYGSSCEENWDGEDAHVWIIAASEGSYAMNIGSESNGDNEWERIHDKFDITSIPDAADVKSAEYETYLPNSDPTCCSPATCDFDYAEVKPETKDMNNDMNSGTNPESGGNQDYWSDTWYNDVEDGTIYYVSSSWNWDKGDENTGYDVDFNSSGLTDIEGRLAGNWYVVGTADESEKNESPDYWEMVEVLSYYSSFKIGYGRPGYWDGSESTDWNTAGNWENNQVPSSTTDVVIPSGCPNDPTINPAVTANCHDITINSGVLFTINNTQAGGGTFNVYGSITNNGDIYHTSDVMINLYGSSSETFGGTGNFSYNDEWVSFILRNDNSAHYTLSNDITLLQQFEMEDGTQFSLSSYNFQVISYTLNSGGTFNQNTGTLKIGGSTIVFNGTFNCNTGTTFFNSGDPAHGYDATNQTIPSETYYNLKIRTNNGFTATVGDDYKIIWDDDFESDKGWSLSGEFERDTPGGLGGEHGNADPSSAYEGNYALGTDLTGLGSNSGDYEGSLGDREYKAESPAFNCTNYSNVHLKFYRWLNVESPTYDHAYIDVYDGSTWHNVYSNPVESDDAWSQKDIDISAYADGNSGVKVRFCLGATDGSWFFSGWNIDELEITGNLNDGTVSCNNLEVINPSTAGGIVTTDEDIDISGNFTLGSVGNNGITLNITTNGRIYGDGGASDNFTMGNSDNNSINVTYAHTTNLAIDNFNNEDSYTFYGTVTYNSASNQEVMGNTYKHITFNGAGTKSLQTALNVNGNFTINNGTVTTTGSNYNIDVAGNWSNSGTFTSGSNTVTFDGTSTIITGGTGPGQDFYNVTLDGTSATLSTNDMDMDGDFTVTSGIFTIPSSRTVYVSTAAKTITVSDGLDVTGTLRHQCGGNSNKFKINSGGLVTVNSGGAIYAGESGDQYADINIDGGELQLDGGAVYIEDGLTQQNSGVLDINSGNLYIKRYGGGSTGTTMGYLGWNVYAAATIDIAGGDVYIRGQSDGTTSYRMIDWNPAATVNIVGGTIHLITGTNEDFTGYCDFGGHSINNLIVNRPGFTTYLWDNDVDVNGDFTINAGTFSIGDATHGYRMEVYGISTIDNGTTLNIGDSGTEDDGNVFHSHGNLTLHGIITTDRTIKNGYAEVFTYNTTITADGDDNEIGGDVQVSGNGSTTTLSSNLSVQGDMIISNDINDKLDIQSNTIDIDGCLYVKGSNATLSSSGTINLHGYGTYSGVDDITFWIQSGGNFTPSSGKIAFIGTDPQLIKIQESTNFNFYNTDIGDGTNTHTVSLWDDADQKTCDINGYMETKTNSTLDANGKPIEVAGYWTNNGTFTSGTGTVTFDGTSTQNVTSSGDNFYNLIIDNNNSGTAISLQDDATVNKTLTLTDGIVTTGNHYLITTSTTAADVTGYSNESFVNGNLRRYITNGSTYALPVGQGTATTDYHRADIISSITSGTTFINASVSGITESGDNIDANVNTSQDGTPLIEVLGETAIWTISPDNSPTGSYGINLYVENIGMSVTDDNKFCIVKRPDASTTYADWNTYDGSTSIPAADAPGRIYNSGNGYAQRTGYISFSQFAIAKSDDLPLPIELLSFSAECFNNIVELNWTTASEINNDFFKLEKSTDLQNFEIVTTVKGAGTTNETKYYSYTDENPCDGISYYRLKQTDFDGAFKYSDIEIVDCSGLNNPDVIFYPNPFRDELIVRTINISSIKANIEIYDMLGSKVTEQALYNIDKNNNEFVISLSKLFKGTYLIKFTSDDFIKTQKVIKNQ